MKLQDSFEFKLLEADLMVEFYKGNFTEEKLNELKNFLYKKDAEDYIINFRPFVNAFLFRIILGLCTVQTLSKEQAQLKLLTNYEVIKKVFPNFNIVLYPKIIDYFYLMREDKLTIDIFQNVLEQINNSFIETDDDYTKITFKKYLLEQYLNAENNVKYIFNISILTDEIKELISKENSYKEIIRYIGLYVN